MQKLKKKIVSFYVTSKNFTSKTIRCLNRGVSWFKLAITSVKNYSNLCFQKIKAKAFYCGRKARVIYEDIEASLWLFSFKYIQPLGPYIVPFWLFVIMLRILIVIILLILYKLGIADIPLDTTGPTVFSKKNK